MGEVGAHARAGIAEAEALVGDDPRDDGGMVAVAADQVLPLGGQPPRRLRRELVEARHLRPDEKAEDVGVVEPERILRLLVLAGAIESESLGELDVAAQRLAGAGGEQPSGKVTLIQHQPLDERLAVEPPAAIPCLDGAEAEVAADAILEQANLDAVELRRSGPPWHDRFELEPPSAGLA